MTEAQWQDGMTRRLRALNEQIRFYADRTDSSIDRVLFGMAVSERDQLTKSLNKSLAA